MVESWLTDQLSGEVDDLVFIIVQESILLSKEIFLTPDDSGLKIEYSKNKFSLNNVLK